MVIGVISDTHDVLNEDAVRQLRGVDAILHAGDIAGRDILDQLQQVAPVTPVCGNGDKGRFFPELPEFVAVTLGGYRIFMMHNFCERYLRLMSPEVQKCLREFQPQIVISGHTHVATQYEKEGVLYLNPGSPTRPRETTQGSVARLHLNPEAPVAEICWL